MKYDTDVRQCTGCQTKYTPIEGTTGVARWCPECGSPGWVPAVVSDYRSAEDRASSC